MRNLLHLLVYVFIGLSSVAQEYHPFIDDDKVWLEAAYIGANECEYEEIYQLRFGGDTTINGNMYRKILKRPFHQVSPGPYCPPFEADEEEEILNQFFMREDTMEHRVYLWHIDINDYPEGQEILLFDFTLEVGDTVPVSNYATLGIPLIITDVSDFTLLNGEIRKRIEYVDGAYIEGVGGEYGLFQPLMPGIGFWWNVLCLKLDEENIYSHPNSLSQCNWMTSVDEIPRSAVQLYPNPNHGTFTFSIEPLKTSYPMRLVIFNTKGQQVYDRMISVVTNIDTNLPVGLYHWQLQSAGLPVEVGKLVVD